MDKALIRLIIYIVGSLAWGLLVVISMGSR